MDTLLLILVLSIFTNILLFRWGVGEHRSRRLWEQEAVVLQRALRHGKPDGTLHFWGIGIWLVGGFLLIMAILTAFV